MGVFPLPFFIQIMKKIETIYLTNKFLIDQFLSNYSYRGTLKDFIQAVKDLGEPFLMEVYNEISQHWENADGKGWQKFKNIFGQITGVMGKVNTGTNIANSFLNPPTDTYVETNPEPPKKEPWKPNMYLWGGIAAAVILILLLIYFFKS